MPAILILICQFYENEAFTWRSTDNVGSELVIRLYQAHFLRTSKEA